jgi:hypothetical protein
MNSDAVWGGSAGAGFAANGFHDDPLVLVVLAGFFVWLPKKDWLLAAGFDEGVKTCFVFDHMLDGAEPILLSIDGCAGGGAGG